MVSDCLHMKDKKIPTYLISALQQCGYQCIYCKSKKNVTVHPGLNTYVAVCRYCISQHYNLKIKIVEPTTDLIYNLAMNGMTYEEIGEYLGHTRQHIHAITKEDSQAQKLLHPKTN